MHLNDHLRITLTKFRCRNHKLPISLCRFSENVSNLCTLCNSGEVRDEFHYLFNCIELKYERKKFVFQITIMSGLTLWSCKKDNFSSLSDVVQKGVWEDFINFLYVFLANIIGGGLL